MDKELPKILYVDDEGINLIFFTINFQKDFQIITTSSPVEALKIASDNKELRLVVTDYRMPVMNGLDLIRKMKEDDPERTCILISGYLMEDIMNDNNSQALIHSFVSKPWNKEILKDTFHNILYQPSV